MKEQFVIDGIDTQAVMAIDGTTTGVAMIWGPAQLKLYRNFCGANAELTPARLQPHLPLISDAGCIADAAGKPVEYG